MREENFGGENFSRREIASRDCFLVINVLVWVNQDRARFFVDRVIVRPFGQNFIRGIEQTNFDPLIGRKIERDHVLTQVGHGQLRFELPDFREPDRLRRNLELENKTA